MKVQLTIADRISFNNLLPEKDTYENLCLKAEILDKTKFSSEEIETNKISSKISSKENIITWVETEPKEVDLNTAEITFIMANLKRVSDAKELTMLQIPTYKKFAAL